MLFLRNGLMAYSNAEICLGRLSCFAEKDPGEVVLLDSVVAEYCELRVTGEAVWGFLKSPFGLYANVC